jgi:hypothetical protein
MFASNYIVLNITMVMGLGIMSALLPRDQLYWSKGAFFIVSGLALIGALLTWFGAVKLKMGMGTPAARAANG